MTQATLVFLKEKDRLLLAMKKRGFGVGKWNGVGGKVKEGESPAGAAVRETMEEIGVCIRENEISRVGDISFYFPEKPGWEMRVHIFLAEKWVGKISESEEMRPSWFLNGEIPYKDMWSDDPFWLPLVLVGKKVKGEFYFKGDGGSFGDYKISEVTEL